MKDEDKSYIEFLEWKANHYKGIAKSIDLLGGMAILVMGFLVLYLIKLTNTCN